MASEIPASNFWTIFCAEGLAIVWAQIVSSRPYIIEINHFLSDFNIMTEKTQTKEPLFAKLKRKTTNAGHTTRLGAYKTKKAAQITAIKSKILDRKKKFGVEYMDLIEQKKNPQVLRGCIEHALKELDELRKQMEKHQKKIVAKEELTKAKIENSIPHYDEDDDDSSSSSAADPLHREAPSSQRKPNRVVQSPKSPVKKAPPVNPSGRHPSSPSKQPSQAPASPYRHTPSSSKPKVTPTKLKPAPKADAKPEAKAFLRGNKNKKPSKNWKLEEIKFSGSASCSKRGKQEVVKGKSIQAGVETFKANPELYVAIYYQSNMIDWAPDKHQYTLIHREGTENYKPQGVGSNGWMTLFLYTYERLPPYPNDILPKQHRDAYTDNMTFNRKKLHNTSNKPILPGRGMGVGDTPDLKIIGDVDPSDIHQGRVGDCWLLSGISALAEFDGAVKKLFRKTKNLDSMPRADQPNMYTLTLWDLSTWKEVDIVVDERLCSYQGGLLASKPSEDGELWVCYIEKAVAIHCGGWDKLVGGQCTHAWALLTGCKHQYSIWKNPKTGKYCCHGKYNTHESRWAKLQNSPHDGETGMWRMPWPSVGGGGSEGLELTEDELFLRLVAWDRENYIVGAGTKGDSDKSKTDGLVDNHAYSVIESYDNVCGTGIGLLKVRNPWGNGEIEDGEFDDDGPGWDKYPQIKKLLKPVVADDGIFWVTKQEFFQYFQTIYLSASNMTEFLED